MAYYVSIILLSKGTPKKKSKCTLVMAGGLKLIWLLPFLFYFSFLLVAMLVVFFASAAHCWRHYMFGLSVCLCMLAACRRHVLHLGEMKGLVMIGFNSGM